MKTVVTTLNAKYIHMNLAIRYLKAYAEPEFEVEMVEYTIKEPIISIVTDLYKRNPDVIGFSCYIWNIEETLKIIDNLKKIKPDLKVILGGPEVCYEPIHFLEKNKGIDVIVMGEGEGPFKELLHCYSKGDSIENVKGIAYRIGDKIKINPQAPYIDLKTIPSPFRFEEDRKDLANRIIYIEGSRGCPFQCQYCVSSIEQGVRYFDPEQVKEDIRYLIRHGARTIKFADRTFNMHYKKALDMFQFLIDEYVPGLTYQFEIQADILRQEIIDFLNEHAPKGAFRFEIGIQSTNEETIKQVKRRQNFERLSRAIEQLKAGGKIVLHLDLIAGLPEEDYDSFKKTFNETFQMVPEELQLGFLKMLRGTGLRLRAKEWNYEYMDHPPYEVLHNNVLSFNDILRIKQAEDILEKYWNKHRMDETVKYLAFHCFETPFDFFQRFGAYWEERGWQKIGHQLEDLFVRLYEFLQFEQVENLDIIFCLMKFDYLSGQRFKPRKVWWEKDINKEERVKLYHRLQKQTLPEVFSNFTERDWMKQVFITSSPIDLLHFKETGEILHQAHILLFHYDGIGNCTYYQLKDISSD